MSLFGVELNHQMNKIITEMRLTLQKHKLFPNLRTIYRSFAQHDPEVCGMVQPHLFQKAINENGLFVKKVELTILVKAFGNQQGLVNWFQFLQALRVGMNQKRRNFIEDVYDFLANQHQKLTPENILAHFNPSEIDLVKAGKMSVARAHQNFICLLPMPDGHVVKEEFMAFFEDLSVNFPHDEPFIKYVGHCWGYVADRCPEASEQTLRFIIKSLRFKLIQKSKGTNDEFLMRKLFNEFDENKNGFISPFELDLMLKQLELPISAQLVEPLFKKLDKNCTGNIQYDEFKRFIFFDAFPA